MLGGILFNLIFAYFALILLFMLGLPKSEFLYPRNAIPVINTIQPESPAEKAQLLAGDRIITIDNQKIDEDAMKAYKLIASMPGKETLIHVDRNGQEIDVPVTLGKQTSGRYCYRKSWRYF